MTKILYVTDLNYHANGRNYHEEDIFLTSCLQDHFNIIMTNPRDLHEFEDMVDVIVLRNTGPVIYYKNDYNSFRTRVTSKLLKTYNAFNGHGDMNGKSYLIELTRLGFPVIPTVNHAIHINELPKSDQYLLKPIYGADSVGMKLVSAADLMSITRGNSDMLIQPMIHFTYEVSFYFIDGNFQYALYAPDKEKRWELKIYQPNSNDLEFAHKFIRWNKLNHGIERIDACRTEDGRLLLVELEDLNPYLSLSVLDFSTRNSFVEQFIQSLQRVSK